VGDLASKLKAAGSRLEPAWSDAERAVLAHEATRRLERRRRVSVVASALVAAGVLLTGALLLRPLDLGAEGPE
jgi:hypothetical protein